MTHILVLLFCVIPLLLAGCAPSVERREWPSTVSFVTKPPKECVSGEDDKPLPRPAIAEHSGDQAARAYKRLRNAARADRAILEKCREWAKRQVK